MSDTSEERIQLQEREVLQLRRSCGAQLIAMDGVVWITVVGNIRDIMIQPGEALIVPSDRLVYVSPLFGAVTFAIRRVRSPVTSAVKECWRNSMARIRALFGWGVGAAAKMASARVVSATGASNHGDDQKVIAEVAANHMSAK